MGTFVYILQACVQINHAIFYHLFNIGYWYLGRTKKLGHAINSCRLENRELLPNGDYQSFISCTVYATCVEGFLIDNRPCAAGAGNWDDYKKACVRNSKTCP